MLGKKYDLISLNNDGKLFQNIKIKDKMKT